MTMKTTKNGQAAIEAMIAMGILALLFMVVYIVYSAKSDDTALSKQQLDESADCLSLSTMIGSIFLLGDSSKGTIHIYHELSVEPTQQRIESKHAFCTIPLSTVRSNLLSTAPFNLSTGKVTLENNQGLIIISNN